MGFLKFLVIVLCIAIGAIFLASGLGATIPLVEFKDVTAHQVPVGFGFLGLAALIAKFWVISSVTESTTTTQTDGGVTTKTTKIERKSIRAPR